MSEQEHDASQWRKFCEDGNKLPNDEEMLFDIGGFQYVIRRASDEDIEEFITEGWAAHEH